MGACYATDNAPTRARCAECGGGILRLDLSLDGDAEVKCYGCGRLSRLYVGALPAFPDTVRGAFALLAAAGEGR